MAFLGKARKEDLANLASELGENIPENAKIIDLKNIIIKSKSYEESFVKELINTIISDRVERERVLADAKQQEHEIKMRELELKSIEAKIQTEASESSVEEVQAKMGSTFLGYLNMMKGVILEPPAKSEEWPFFFHHAERMFKLYEVPEQYHGKIILHCVKGYSKGLNAILNVEELENYAKIKEVVLKEHRITPLQYKKNFDMCLKSPNENYVQYSARIEAALELYLKSREVDSLNKIKELIITDKIKDNLPYNVKSHILLKESEKWFPLSELVQEIDNFIVSVPRMSSRFNNPSQDFRPHLEYQKKIGQFQNDYKSNKIPFGEKKLKFVDKKSEQNSSLVGNKKIIKCFNCHEEGHVKRFCTKVNTISKEAPKSPKLTRNDLERKGLNKVCIQLNKPSFDWEIPVGEIDGELPRVELEVAGRKFQGIIDSGAEITVLRKSVVPEEYLQSSGKLFLRPAIGPQVEAKLISIPLSLWTEKEDIRPYVHVHAAVVEGLHEEALVTPKVFRLLKEQKEKYLGYHSEVLSENDSKKDYVFNLEGRRSEKEAESNSAVENLEEDVVTTPVEGIVYMIETHSESENENNPPISQVQRFRKEQSTCTTLQGSFADARQNKNNYWIESDLLYHLGKVGGEKYVQLVIPESRRREILKLAHETPTAGHLASKKTRDRIAMSFWWEGMPKEVKKFCESCHDCQLRRKARIKDRTPIVAVGRPELPFQVVNADILGPIEPKSSRGHRFVLCVMDQHSRWPEAIPIKSLTAKAACDAFMEIFTRTGIPRVIAMDNGTNFAAQLTKELLKLLGSVPKFSTPGYPQSNGLVERWIETMKSMLHHAINSQGRGWDKQLPYLLWAYREVPNATTGVPPFVLVHGRPPVGPLSILKSSWEDEVILPQGIGESVTDYLGKLRKRLESAVSYAENISKDQQGKYVHYHNLRSKNSEFNVGQEVVVLVPDSTNKLCSKWKGPAEIVERKSPHSYTVKFSDGSVRHLHQNKLRKYIQPISTIGVIYEADEEFGEIQHVPLEQCESMQEGLKELEKTDHWNNLSFKQRTQLFKVMQKYKTVFDGELKKVKVGEHAIRLKPEIERKQPHIYKVPESLKPGVEKQIAELLEKDLIEPSTAEIVYPLVCVAKKDGTIRLCCDYRTLNAESKISPFPMQNSEQLRFKAGGAKFLTTLDILKGYWEIPLEKNSRELTSFVSPKGQYQWKVMPFGLSGAPATFQRIMNQALRPYNDFAESFLDDIVIFSSDWSDHLEHIETVLKLLENLNFSANLGKCSFAKSKVRYLGHVVGSGEHGPDPDKIAVIRDLKVPKTKKSLRSVLGLMNYYREYIPHYADIAKPLTDLTKKSAPNEIPWSEEADIAFKSLKDNLCKVTSLATPELNKPFELHADASLTGIGACLMQKDKDGKLKPITFASQKLTMAQTKWSTIEREAFAVIWALGKFEAWTFGSHISVHTDHNPLKYLTEGLPKNARLQRWSLALSRFQLSISHRPGKSNLIADALSRLYEDK